MQRCLSFPTHIIDRYTPIYDDCGELTAGPVTMRIDCLATTRVLGPHVYITSINGERTHGGLSTYFCI